MASSNDEHDKPSEAMMKLLAPDGYYAYLNIPKTNTEIDEDLVKKNYRKLSLKHHPDKPGGDADTFRLLNRAQMVLKTPKLRQQYDILGLDLDDDDEQHGDSDAATDSGDQQTTSQGIVHDMASMVLTTILQLGVRTIMMATVSLLVVRYRWVLYPALAFLGFIAFRNHSIALQGGIELISPFLIGAGLVIMYQSSAETGSGILYWLGESLVIAMFTYNSVSTTPQLPSPIMLGGTVIFSLIAALWLRGKFWNYFVVIGFEFFLAIFVAMAFPVMEMVLEAILNEKLKKVGEKVRLQHQHMEKYYNSKS